MTLKEKINKAAMETSGFYSLGFKEGVEFGYRLAIEELNAEERFIVDERGDRIDTNREAANDLAVLWNEEMK